MIRLLRWGPRNGPKPPTPVAPDRKSTRLNSSHLVISYAVFCLKKKKARLYIAPIGSAVANQAVGGARSFVVTGVSDGADQVLAGGAESEDGVFRRPGRRPRASA